MSEPASLRVRLIIVSNPTDPRPDIPMSSPSASEDPDVKRTLDWLLSFMQPGEWDRRKAAVKAHLQEIHRPRASLREGTGVRAIKADQDQIAWYLYLAETSLLDPVSNEVNQASRVLPVFARLGSDFDRLQKIGGVDTKVRELLTKSKTTPDSVLFEMLVALLWARKGYPDVTFIPADPSEKRPDIRAASPAGEWFIETKRLSTNSEYSEKERAKWLRMWRLLKDCMIRDRLSVVLDIAFHVELETLDDAFARDQLQGKLKLIHGSCHLISNDTWDVHVGFVDYDRINKHFDQYYVKQYSRQMMELVGGKWERGKGFTFVANTTNVRIGPGEVGNEYVDRLHFAAGAYWHCDAARAYEKKARDIRSHLADAVNQLPASGRGAVHIGVETMDGELVEAERYERIVNTVSKFDALGKDLRWVFCHLFESYAPPEKPWYIDETVYWFGTGPSPGLLPLARPISTVVPDEEGHRPGVHWLRAAP